MRPKTSRVVRTITTGKVSVRAVPRTVSHSVRAWTGPENELNSPSTATSSGNETENRCGASAPTSSVRSTSEGVFCSSRKRRVNAPTLAGPSSMIPLRSIFARNLTGAASAPGSNSSTPAGADAEDRPTNVLPERYPTVTTPLVSASTGRSSIVAACAPKCATMIPMPPIIGDLQMRTKGFIIWS